MSMNRTTSAPDAPQRGALGATPPREAGWFGDRPVDPSDKTRLVHGVFDSVSGRYDLMNDLMSGGVHRLWKSRLIAAMRPRAGERLIDVAGGTGDISIRFIEAAEAGSAAENGAGSGTSATICDLTEGMVRIARDRAVDRGLVGALDVVVGNAESLPVADRSADAYVIAFGLRNVTHIDPALAEARRVLRPGGRFFCLEFSHVVLPVLRRLYELYSFNVIPRLGGIVANDRDSYQYLVESIRRFPPQEELAERMKAAGLWRPRWVNLSGGIAAIHSARRI